MKAKLVDSMPPGDWIYEIKFDGYRALARIEEHYTDTAGFTDHVFAMMSLLGFRFAPRIRDLADKRLYVPRKDQRFPALAGLIGGTINSKLIAAQWSEVLRLVASIRQGTVTASLVVKEIDDNRIVSTGRWQASPRQVNLYPKLSPGTLRRPPRAPSPMLHRAQIRQNRGNLQYRTKV